MTIFNGVDNLVLYKSLDSDRHNRVILLLTPTELRVMCLWCGVVCVVPNNSESPNIASNILF